MRKCLYKDNYVELYRDELVVTWYYFPIPTSKSIKLSEIKKIYYKKQSTFGDIGTAKDWGMSLTPIWWACDMRRHWPKQTHRFNVVVDVGTRIRKGFTVQDIAGFLNQLKDVVPAGTPIVNDIPFNHHDFTRDRPATSLSTPALNYVGRIAPSQGELGNATPIDSKDKEWEIVESPVAPHPLANAPPMLPPPPQQRMSVQSQQLADEPPPPYSEKVAYPSLTA